METTRIGYALGLGAFPKFFLTGKLKLVLSGLFRSLESSKKLNMAEARRDIVTALTQ